MIKNIGLKNPSDIKRLVCIRQRNRYLKSGKYSTVDSDFFVIGEAHKEAAMYLETCIAVSESDSELVSYEERTEVLYDVQVWNCTDVDLSEVI